VSNILLLFIILEVSIFLLLVTMTFPNYFDPREPIRPHWPWPWIDPGEFGGEEVWA
jgi:hypothetical protein